MIAYNHKTVSILTKKINILPIWVDRVKQLHWNYIYATTSLDLLLLYFDYAITSPELGTGQPLLAYSYIDIFDKNMILLLEYQTYEYFS